MKIRGFAVDAKDRLDSLEDVCTPCQLVEDGAAIRRKDNYMNATQISKSFGLLGVALAAAAINLLISNALWAQDAVAHVPTPVAATPSTGSDIPQSSAVSDKKGPFDWLDQRLPIHFTLDFNSYYDNNIYISPVKSSDYIFNITPGLN